MERNKIRPTRQLRRGRRLIAALSIGLVASSLLPGPAGGAEEFIKGSGQSYAQIYRVGPTAGRLSLAPIIGLSLADYLNTVGRGETKVVDYAGIGVAEPALPENTPSLKVSSTQKDSEKGTTEVVFGQSDGTTGGGIAELYARATDAPLGESRFRLGSISIPGLIEIHDSKSHALTGIVKKGVREAVSITEIGRLDLLGTVSLKGLRWVATQRTGAQKTIAGSFTVEGLSIGGVPVPLPGGPSDLKTLIDPINAAVADTGFAVSMPVVEKRNGQASVSPLSLDIVNSPAGRRYLAPILAELNPTREPIADLFIDLAKQLVETNESAPDLTVGVLAADLTVGIASGSSQLHLEFGGVSSYTEGAAFDNPFSGKIDFTPPTLGTAPRTEFVPGRPGTPGGSDPTAVGSEEGVLTSGPAVPGTRTIPGDKGGVAALVGLIGLAVAAALATRDYWKMRQIEQAASS